MLRLQRLLALALTLFLASLALSAQTGDNREQSYQFYVDGVLTAGVIGYSINFNHSTVSRTDSRRLDTAFSADQRQLTLSMTQKGLNRIMDWLNGATDTGAPLTKNVSLVVRTADNTVLARWEFTGVTPTTVTTDGKGPQSEVSAAAGFIFETMKLVQARAD